MQAGVSTACLYPELLEESIYRLAVNGVDNIEIFINTHSELKKSYAHSVANLLKRFDMRCCSLHPFTCEIEQLMFFSDYERRFEDALEYYKLYFRFMNIVGADIFVLHGSKANQPVELFCERYSRLYRVGKEFGIKVALENVSRCRSGSSAFVRDVAGMLGNEFSFVLDTKQAIRAKENPFTFLDAAGSRTEHVHISDSGELGDCLLIGRGRFRFRQFFDKLNTINPDANIILELYRSGFGGISDLISSYNVLVNMTEQYEQEAEK
ncbi:MAG: sugar phosphate isomerase/epimerase [Ruminococcus sp.]|nr:sugar phosphate isomerase/epimerase [Ruminococcus sp.]